MYEDFDRCYRAAQSKDARFDGWFFAGVTSTGIYCRPSCPAMTPKPQNLRFYPTAAAAQRAGFRACKRCRPDATPGSPEWNYRADVVARAMKLIADGVVDREGVAGLARRLGYSERHLNRSLLAEVGAGPNELARAQRAQTARVLIETTDLGFAEVAFAAGFGSIRQFNDTVGTVFATTPTQLRQRRKVAGVGSPGSITVRLPVRAPFAGAELLDYFAFRAVPGIEEVDHDSGVYRRSLDLSFAPAVAELSFGTDHVSCALRLGDLRDLTVAVNRCRRLLDLDADPEAVDADLSRDPMLAPMVARTPGRRVPGTVDGAELAVRAVLGQQVSLQAARTHAGRLVASYGKPLDAPVGGVTHLFPRADEIATANPAGLAMPEARKRALFALTRAICEGEVAIDPSVERGTTLKQLTAIPGIGPWTAGYIGMRALGDTDTFLPSDIGVRNALRKAGLPSDPRSAERSAESWKPWRAYALQHLWASLSGSTGTKKGSSK